MNDEEFLKKLAPIFADDNPILMHITIRDLWFIDSVLSLGWRHPDLSLHQKNWIAHIHDQIEPAILEAHPEAAELLKAGWDEQKDVPVDREQRDRIDGQFRKLSKKYLRKTGRI